MKKARKRLISMLLVCVMMMQATVFAAEIQLDEIGDRTDTVDATESETEDAFEVSDTGETQIDDYDFDSEEDLEEEDEITDTQTDDGEEATDIQVDDAAAAAASTPGLSNFGEGKTIKSTSSTTVESGDNYKLVLKTYTYTNDDMCAQLVENGDIISESCLDFSAKKTMYYKKNVEDVIVKTMTADIGSPDDESNDIVIDDDSDDDEVIEGSLTSVGNGLSSEPGYEVTANSSSFKKKGKIYYNASGNTYGVHVACMTKKRPNITHNMNGKYQDITDLTLALAGILSLPGGVAAKVADWISAGAGASKFIVKDCNLTCTRTTRRWRLREVGNIDHERYIKGHRYQVTKKSTSKKKVDYTGTYFRPSQFTKKDITLASEIFNRMFSEYTWNVSKWVVY